MTNDKPSGAVDVLSHLEREIFVHPWVAGQRALSDIRDTVAALIARNAELEAENKARNACLQMIYAELQHLAPWSESNDMETVDEIMCGLGLLAQDRDALAVENKALRDDAERWREVARRYDASKTSAACKVLEGLGLDPTPYQSFAENVDAARATAGETA